MEKADEDLDTGGVTEVAHEKDSRQIEQEYANGEGSGVNWGDKDIIDDSGAHCLVAMLPIRSEVKPQPCANVSCVLSLTLCWPAARRVWPP